jgi:hypothetical protein
MVVTEWPDVEELKALLDVTAGDFDEHLQELLDAGIAQVKQDRGGWDELTDQPDEKLHNAALRAAILMRPNAPTFGIGGPTHQDVNSDPGYQSLMQGKRRRFGLA